ncbi:MAG: rod-binding protein [Defluviitaleaceae bacterium]|nr:rod-binding protein [Defluviitaleaceae bacterium]
MSVGFGVNLIDSYSARREWEVQNSQNTAESFQSTLERLATEGDRAALKDAAIEFEAYFIQMMFSTMRRTVNSEGGFLPKSNAEKIFEDMLFEEASKSAARAGGIGLASFIYKQLSIGMPHPPATEEETEE